MQTTGVDFVFDGFWLFKLLPKVKKVWLYTITLVHFKLPAQTDWQAGRHF